MSLVEDIKRELSWKNVDFHNGYYRIWMSSPKDVQRLRQNSKTFWLDLGDKYVDLPMSIIIQNNRYTAQYYTFNGKPHRVDGPAQIISDGNTLIRRWYHHGEPFNQNGPTYEKAEGVKAEEIENGIVWMTMRKLVQLHETKNGPASFPRPRIVEFEQAGRCLSPLDDMIDCQDKPSFMADSFNVQWTIGDTDTQIIPKQVKGRGLVEKRNDKGKVTKRTMHSTIWSFYDQHTPLDLEMSMKIGNFIVSEISEGISFHGDFYINSAYEMTMADHYREEIIG